MPHNTPFSLFTSSIEGPTWKCNSFAILPLLFPIKKREFTLFKSWLPFTAHWAVGLHSFLKNSQQFGKVWFFMYRIFCFLHKLHLATTEIIQDDEIWGLHLSNPISVATNYLHFCFLPVTVPLTRMNIFFLMKLAF